MKILSKRLLFCVLNFLSYFIKIKKDYDFTDLNIIILLKKPLGLGDIVMLSPFIKILENELPNKIYIVSEYDCFIEFEKILYIKPEKINDEFLLNSLVISPTLTFSHFKYIFKAKYFIGYFISNKLISNFISLKYNYNPKSEHYLQKTFPILDILRLKYNSANFNYPKISLKKFESHLKNYIVAAPYSNWLERQYPQNGYLKLFKDILMKYEHNIVLIGSNSNVEVSFNKKIENELNSSKIINLTGKTNVHEMNYIIQNSELFIGNDSGPSHIAYIIGKKVVVFFGSVLYENRLPLNKKLKNKILAVDSREKCLYFPCYDGYNKPNCFNKNKYSCIKEVNLTETQLKYLLDS